jgi:rhamnose utilization protein RhaD (predicted bifunctional aldolase and dehydrogenase)
MNFVEDERVTSVINYCDQIGQDSLLVQGAGGNVSWKDGDTLWVKASGTWLAAASKEIFVPVDLQQLRVAIDGGHFDVKPKALDGGSLKPSIETLLHALMPQKVVVHLHAIEVLAYLVRENCEELFQALLTNCPRWVMVDYYKPGAELASAVNSATAQDSAIKIVFLRNHGVVIGGDDVEEINHTLTLLISQLSAHVGESTLDTPSEIPTAVPGLERYVPVVDRVLHQLALDPKLFAALGPTWALYPDHVVFLGAQAHTYPSFEVLSQVIQERGSEPELVFVQGRGVYVKADFTKAKYAQLLCYYEVIRRQPEEAKIRALSEPQVFELLHWDAELYRIQVSQ